MKVLFVYWHGLGDSILATPAIKKYKQTTGNYIGWMMLRRFQNAELFTYNPYIDQIHWCSDSWQDFGPNHEYGKSMVKAEAYALARKEGYDKVVIVDHQSGSDHKILRVAREMGVTLNPDELHTEFHWDEEETFEKYVKDNQRGLPIHSKWLFFNGQTGLPRKNLDLKSAHEFNKEYLLPIVSPDFSWDCSTTPISLAAWYMKYADKRVLVDSSLYHIAHALDLPVDLVYFARGPKVWKIVHPLHTDNEVVIFGNED